MWQLVPLREWLDRGGRGGAGAHLWQQCPAWWRRRRLRCQFLLQLALVPLVPMLRQPPAPHLLPLLLLMLPLTCTVFLLRSSESERRWG